ncbi:MAG: DJ-1/PfpI family protein [Aridibacter famidurans]|nr:DJ-1/PfpI family protein [Aridibacter famidurans]
MPIYTIPKVQGLPRRRPGRSSRKRIVVVTHRGSNTLEFIGPIYVLQEANLFLEYSDRTDIGYDIEVVTTAPGPVFEVQGLTMVADTVYHELTGDVDTLIVQAVDEDENTLANRRFIGWLADMSDRARRVVSICVGTYFLAEAGLLEGKRATTHWAACAHFAKQYPNVKLEPEPIFIKDGDVYTSAGATSGLDLTVALVEEDYGHDLARRVAQGLVMYLKRPGTQAQFSVFTSRDFPKEERISWVQNYISENPDKDLSVESLARKTRMSPRNFSRVFSNEVGLSPGKFVELSRLERARYLLEDSDLSLPAIAEKCGYETADGLRLAFNRHLDVSPREYRRRFSSSGYLSLAG